MKRFYAAVITVLCVFILAASPVYAGGDKVQGDNSAQGDVQGDLGRGVSPGDDKMGNQV